jgi:predicted PurR-regulated permease PerM
MADPQSDRDDRRAGFAPATRVLITLAAAAIAIIGLSLGRNIVAPFALAAVLTIIVFPLRKVPGTNVKRRWLGTGLMIVAAYAILLALGVLLVLALAQFSSLIAGYSAKLASLGQSVLSFFQGLGFSHGDAAKVSDWIDPSVVLHWFAQVGSSIVSTGVTLFIALALILFMAADAGRFDDIAAEFASTRQRTITAISEFSLSVRRYFIVSTIFGGIVAIIDGLLLWALHVPGAFVWAVLAFVTNFIPNIGFYIGILPPALLALASGGWGLALAVVIMYIVVNFIIQTLIQPRFVSEAVRLSLTLTFVSVIFWTAVIGPLGAIMAVPFTLLFRTILLSAHPGGRWARWLTGDQVGPEIE